MAELNLALLAQLESLQDEVLQGLEELNDRVEATLAQFGAPPRTQRATSLTPEDSTTDSAEGF